MHRDPWPEMLQTETNTGIRKEVIFYDNMSIIYSECEDYEESNRKLRVTKVCKRWEETVKPWLEWSIRPPKVFDLCQQAEGSCSRIENEICNRQS